MNLKLFRFALAVFAIIITLNFAPLRAQQIKDIIPPVRLTAGVPTTLVISDMFYSSDYNVKFNGNNLVEVQYTKNDSLVVFKSKSDFEGVTTVEMEHLGKKYDVIVKSIVPRLFKFTFKPDKPYKHIFCFGNFCSWDRSKYEMKDVAGNGIYEVMIPLDAGRYEYKMFCDGAEIVDSGNPDQVSNGMGSFNNVIIIKDKYPVTNFLHNMGLKKVEYGVEFTFAYEKGNETPQLKYENVTALFNNIKLPKQNVVVEGKSIRMLIPAEMLKGETTLRVCVTDQGQTTNTQTIVLHDGEVGTSSAKSFTWYDGVIYSLMTDRFNDGDYTNNMPVIRDSVFMEANYQGGDFQGIINKLNDGYFDSLGINTLWLSPVYDNPNGAYREFPAPHRWYTGYHGYWPMNESDVDDHFGTLETLKELVSTAHKHNIKVLLDFVSGHVHEKNPLYTEHPDWFGTYNLPDGRKNLRLWDEYRLTTWFEPYLPKFDYERSKAATEFITDNAIWWLKNSGADGFRHDAVKHVPNIFWRTLTSKLKSQIEPYRDTKVYQIGETFGGYDLISSYVNNGQLSSQFNFSLYDVAVQVFINPKVTFGTLNSEMMKTFDVYGNLHLMGNIMDSHDKIRYMAYADGALELNQGNASEIAWKNPPVVTHKTAYKKTELYYAYMLTIPGLPVIYYGSEWGMTGSSDPDNRRMMKFFKGMNQDEKEMFAEVSKLVKFRNQHPALRYGDFLTLEASENIYSYIRSDMTERILTVLNKAGENAKVEVKLPALYNTKTLTDFATGEKLQVDNNKVIVPVNANGYRLLILHSN